MAADDPITLPDISDDQPAGEQHGNEHHREPGHLAQAGRGRGHRQHVAGAGLVGRVIRVAPNASVVRLVLDPQAAVVGRLGSSGTTGVVTGQGDRELRMSFLDPNAVVTAPSPPTVSVAAPRKKPRRASRTWSSELLRSSVTKIPSSSQLQKV